MKVLNCKNIIFIILIVNILVLLCACSSNIMNDDEGSFTKPIEHPTEYPVNTKNAISEIWPYEFEVLFSEDQAQTQKYVFFLGMYKDDFKNILKERNIEIYRDDSHGSYGSSIWGEDIHAFFDTDGNLKDIVISGKVESPMGLRVGDSIEKVYELYGKEHQFHDEPGGTVLHYVFPSNIFFISINEDKVVTGMGMKVSVNPNEIETYEVENSVGSSMSGGAGSAIPEPGMRNLELIQGSYFKDIEGKQGKLEILGASPMGINFKFEIENNVELQGSADFIDGTDPKYASNFFTRAVYENGLIYFEKLDNGNIKITYSDKPEYSGEWIKE